MPEKLKAGADETLVQILRAKGVQIYECRAKKDQAAGYEWAFVAPQADLFDARGSKVGRHRLYGGLLFLPGQVRSAAMAIQLDHLLVPARDRVASAKFLAELLGVPWAKSGVGPFSPVFVNDGLTLDFDEAQEPFPRLHFCFRVDQADFDAILGRIVAAGLPYRSSPHGPVDFKVSRDRGGSGVYWNEPDDHVWEMLTVSYARSAT